MARLALIAALVLAGSLSPHPALSHDRPDAAQVRQAVDALPLLGTLDGVTPVVIRGRLPRRDAARMVSLAAAIQADVERRFVAGARGDARPPVTVCLAASDADYRALAARFDDTPSDLGFYRPDLRIALVNLARGVGNLRHELVHPLLGDDFPGIPAWLNEGIASLYGTSRLTGGRFQFLANYRLRHFRQALAAGALPTLDQLASAGPAEMYGPAKMTYYATARMALLYLDRAGGLDRFYRAMRDADAAARPRLLAAAIDWSSLVRWSRRLRVGQPAPAPR